jgi:hypothetical protein
MRALRIRIRTLMIGTAVVAAILPWVDAVGLVALALMAGVIAVPVLWARPGHRLEVAVWVLALHPAMVVVYLYATWIAGRCVLGHWPRFIFDDLMNAGAVVRVPAMMTTFSIVGCLIALVAAIVLFPCWVQLWHRPRWNPLVVLPLVWGLAYGVLLLDPMGVREWIMG